MSIDNDTSTESAIPATTTKSKSFQSASIAWHNVNVWVKPSLSMLDALTFKTQSHGSQIIKNVSGKVKAGSTLAIMGASGAGKTTLLNVLNCRNLTNFHVDGIIYINDRLADIDMITSMSAYVQQEDMFLPTLTVREHLVFQALVRIPSSVSESAKIERIDEVMSELGLDKCADTRVGGSRHFKGISGGELKRLSFAAEVLTNPSIMFCDEPTSGLDSFMAANLVSIINKMAQNGRTIICTIHQPSSETFEMFQNLLLLADGRVAYFGELKSAIKHFSTMGLQCPENYNPADYFVHELAVVPGREIECRKKINRICDYYERSLRDKQDSLHQKSFGSGSSFSSTLGQRKKRLSRYKTNRLQQYIALTWRSHLTVIREPALTYVRLSQALMNSLVLGIIFYSQNYDQRGAWNMNGALFLLIVNMTTQNAFAVINVFCSELPIFIREHNNGMYTVDAYFLCKNLAEIPIFVCIPMIFVTIYYYTLNLYPSFDSYLYCMLISVLISACGVSFGYLISCLCRNTDVALSFGPPLIMPFQLLGGYFLNTHSIPSFLRWTKWISWFYYGFDALAVNQWRNVAKLDCDDYESNKNESIINDDNSGVKQRQMCFQDGDDVLKFLSLGIQPEWLDFLGIVILMVSLRFIAYLTLLFIARKR